MDRIPKKSQTIIAIDYDNTLMYTLEFPHKVEPNWEVINKCKELQEKGYCLVLWTCREKKDLKTALKTCKDVGLHFKYVNENPAWATKIWGNDCRKIGASWYVDDKALSIKDFLNKDF